MSSIRPQTSPPPAPPPAPPACASASRPTEGNDLVSFLDRAGLGVYSPSFYSHGFTTIESLYGISPEDLQRMQVSASSFKKLKKALDHFRSTGQVGPATAIAGVQDNAGQGLMPQPYAPQMPPGSHTASLPDATSLGPQAYVQQHMQPPYQKGGIWVDTNPNEGGRGSGYQWVDGPAAAQPPPATPGGAVGYGQAGTQWVDSPASPQAPAPDMVFQWVDSPSYGRAPHQQQYMQAPAASPYFQGVDSPTYGAGAAHATAGQAGLSPYGGAAQGLPDAMRYQQAAMAASQYGQRGAAQYGARPPHALGMEDLTGLRMGGAGADRLPYGQQAGGYQLFDQPGQRRGGAAQAARPAAQARGGRGAQPAEESAARGRNRQVAAVGRQGTDAAAASAGGAGAGDRRSPEASADQQTAAVLESMGTDGLRAMLTSALESLYEDRIKPLANYVKGRLKERSCPEVIVKSFVELYAQHSDLYIVQQPAQGSGTDEATILFQTEPDWFKGWVDIDAPDDPYDEELWDELAKFLDGEHTFAGGRYGMARELMQRNLAFLAKHSLGEVCHIVQLAIQHRRLIVYHRKMLKPIQTVLCQLSPSNGGGAGPVPEGEEIKDMDDLCGVLFRMLIHHPQGIRLCRMKQMIKHEFCRKLSEMAFQCTKLIELFNQEPLAATFVLDTENDGKSIYVRLGNPETFSDPIKKIYQQAQSTEAKQQAATAS
mmetsp:Transcript_13387/g.34497  ORF Transcript_13387/g.34497 Transcript_13387/m.34497 type:complete len:711 (+) Transcript_13387:71-2203(+)